MIPEMLLPQVSLYPNDLFDALPFIPPETFDACVTDPPYHLISIVRRFGKTSQLADTQTSARARARSDGMARLSRGFMGKEWDGGDVAFRPETWAAVFRVLKPGAHLIACGGAKTYHRMACAIEDAGFEIRDMDAWIYSTGFPKSHSVSRGIRKRHLHGPDDERDKRWEGWGTAKKPAMEPICVARKPLIGTVAANVLMYGTGGIHIDACRLPANDNWPPNVAHDGVLDDRYFLCAKASQDERAASDHPTVKPLALMQWLVRLVTPPGGLVLDPFAGSGTTAEACLREGLRASLIERDPEYQDDIRRRIRLTQAGPEERQRAILKAKGKLLDPSGLPLFAGAA